MASLNRVELIGNLGADPEVRFLPDGSKTADLSVATTDKWKDKQTGEWREVTEWHTVRLYKGLADVAGEYLKKGSQVFIEGSIRTERWTDKDSGEDRSRKTIKGRRLLMLGRAPAQADNVPSGADMDEDDIPF